MGLSVLPIRLSRDRGASLSETSFPSPLFYQTVDTLVRPFGQWTLGIDAENLRFQASCYFPNLRHQTSFKLKGHTCLVGQSDGSVSFSSFWYFFISLEHDILTLKNGSGAFISELSFRRCLFPKRIKPTQTKLFKVLIRKSSPAHAINISN